MAVAVRDERAGQGARLLRPFVAQVVGLATGPDLMAGLEELARRGDLSAREAAEVAAAWNRMIGFCQAGRLAAVVDLDRALTPEGTDPEVRVGRGRVCRLRATADELAPLLRMAPQAASRLVGLARRVETRLPAAFDALAEGRMDYTQLGILDTICRDLPDPTTRLVEHAAVDAADRKTAPQLREYLAGEAARLDPAHAARAAARGVQERDVVLRPSPLDGCQRLVADLPRLLAAQAWDAVNGAARAARDAGTPPDGTPEDRTLPQLRADLLVALLTGQTDGQQAPAGQHGRQVPPDGQDGQQVPPDEQDGQQVPPAGRHGWWVPTPQDLARLAGCWGHLPLAGAWWWPPTPCSAPQTCPGTSPGSARWIPTPSVIWPAGPGGGGWWSTPTPAP